MGAKLVKDRCFHNRKGRAGGILKCYVVDCEWVMGTVRRGRPFHAGARRNEFADTRIEVKSEE